MIFEPVLVLRPSKLKWILIWLLCAAFTAGGYLMLRSGELIGWLPLSFFGLGVVVSSLNLLPGSSSLRLTPDGLATTTFYRKSFLRWSDVQTFAAGKVGPNAGVLFNYSAEYRADPRARAFSKAIAGAEGALPDTYGLSAERLAALLNDWKRGGFRIDP